MRDRPAIISRASWSHDLVEAGMGHGRFGVALPAVGQAL
jgi:hypothetical protein